MNQPAMGGPPKIWKLPVLQFFIDSVRSVW